MTQTLFYFEKVRKHSITTFNIFVICRRMRFNHYKRKLITNLMDEKNIYYARTTLRFDYDGKSSKKEKSLVLTPV